MALIDDRGRLFGKVNLIDFALIVFVVVLVPLGYAAYLLFRTPPPRLISVSPNPIVYKKGEQRVRVTGEHLRPFMRATVGRFDAKAFLVERRDAAEVTFDDLPVGTYDLALFDFTEEVARLPNAIRIVPPPLPPSQVVGRFVGANTGVASLVSGAKLGTAEPTAEVLSASPSENGERRATLRIACNGGVPCAVGGTPVEPGRTLAFAMPAGEPLRFVVDEMRIDAVWADVVMRLFAIREVMDLVKAGDVDRALEPEGPNVPRFIRGAVIRTLEPEESTQGAAALNFQQALTDVGSFAGSVTGAGYLPLRTRVATVSLPLQRVGTTWRYRDQIVRAGSGLSFETSDYFVRGFILSVKVPNAPPPHTNDQ
jgi:uncharacterized protein DUF4330